MVFHHREMNSISCGQSSIRQYDFFGSFHRAPVNGQYFIDDAKQSIECRLNGVATLNRFVAVQDLWQDLCIGDQALLLAYKFFKKSLRVRLMSLRSTHQVQGYV